MIRKFSCLTIISSPRGFTLVEIIVTTVISATLLLIAVPSVINGLSKYALYTGARQMATDIRGWQQQALSAGDTMSTYSIQFNPFNDTYQLMINNSTRQKQCLSVYLDLYSTNFPSNELKFNMGGIPISGGGTVTLREKLTRKQYYVIVAPVTGRVRVSSLPPKG
jgi:prepilin-type N-terminal cleavage/methylation domain-containing protein